MPEPAHSKWLAERLERLLPTHYFHLVVTLPHELNPLALFNPELVFNLLFAAASQALQQFARELRASAGPGGLHGSPAAPGIRFSTYILTFTW